jgi:ankyrin repeat protein
MLSGRHKAVVKLLLKIGKVDVKEKDYYRQTLLLWAAENEHERRPQAVA